MTLNLDYVRAQFPALLGDDFIYLDNAGGSLVPTPVAERVADHLLYSPVQHGASYEKSALATDRLKAAQADMAGFINAARPEEVVFASSTTAMLRILGQCYQKLLKSGDQVIVSNGEHESNYGPWEKLQEFGVELIEWPVNTQTWALEIDDLKPLLTDRVKLICFNHVSNILGSLNPVKEATRLAHEVGAKTVIDGVAYAPHGSIDVQELDVDYYIFSTYKTFGPHLAVFYGKYDNLLTLPQQNHFFIGMEETAYKLQPGNANFELSWGTRGLIDYLALLGLHHGSNSDNRHQQARHAFDVIRPHEQLIAGRLLTYLECRDDILLLGKGCDHLADRVPTISFLHKTKASRAIVEAMDPHRIGIRFGDFYARRLALSLGLDPADGFIRISMAHFNTLDEIDRLIEKLDTIL